MRVRAGLSSEPESVDTRMSGRSVPSPKCCRGTGLSPWCAPAFDHRSSTLDHIRIRVTATSNSVASIDPPALIRKRGQSLLPSLSQVDITASIRQIPLLEMLERIRTGMVACSLHAYRLTTIWQSADRLSDNATSANRTWMCWARRPT